MVGRQVASFRRHCQDWVVSLQMFHCPDWVVNLPLPHCLGWVASRRLPLSLDWVASLQPDRYPELAPQSNPE